MCIYKEESVSDSAIKTNRRNLGDLRSQLIIWMVIVTIIPLSLIFVGLFYFYYMPLLNSFVDFSRNLLNRHLLVEQASEAGNLAEKINMFLENLKTQGTLIGRSLALPFLNTSEKNRLLASYLKSFEDIDWVVIRDMNDKIRSVGREEGAIAEQIQVLLSDSVLFQRTLAGEVAFSDPFMLADSPHLAMVVTIPILSELGQPLGALYLQVSMDRIQDLTDSANRLNPGTIYVVDSEGRLMGHSDRKRVLQREDMTDLEIVKKYLIPRVTAGSIPYKDKEGRDVQGAYAPVGNMRWGVVTERLQSLAFISVNEMVNESRYTLRQIFLATILGVISTAILAIGMAALLAVRVTSPLREIASGAIEIAKGDFSQRFSVKGSTEIQQLATTLNYMSEAIERYVRDSENYAHNMRDLFKGSVESLTAAIDAKDPYTRGHSRRVTMISVCIAKEVGLDPDQLDELEIAALMHDVGKIGINDSILQKPSKVTNSELKILQTHPSLGASIMKPIPLLQNMIPGMLHHHERWDGSGYPYGLKRKEISLYGRIIAVADTFDAMTSNRPYQRAYTFEKARDMIKNWSGTKYDPVVVKAFLDVFDDLSSRFLKLRR